MIPLILSVRKVIGKIVSLYIACKVVLTFLFKGTFVSNKVTSKLKNLQAIIWITYNDNFEV